MDQSPRRFVTPPTFFRCVERETFRSAIGLAIANREIEGIRALDRHTIQFKLSEPRPRLLEGLAAIAVPTEVRYG